jgi:hypothetical protein
MSENRDKNSTQVEANRVKADKPVIHTNPDAVNGGRRRVPRRPIDRAVGLLVAGQYMLARSYEIGEGGILIDAPIPLEKGTRAVVSFRIPGVLHGVMLGRVVYVVEPKRPGENPRYGFQFDEVAFDVKRKIRNYVASSTGVALDARSEALDETLSR